MVDADAVMTAGTTLDVRRLDFCSGQITGTGTHTVSERMIWRTRTLTGGGATDIPVGAVLYLVGPNGRVLSDRLLNIYGQTGWISRSPKGKKGVREKKGTRTVSNKLQQTVRVPFFSPFFSPLSGPKCYSKLGGKTARAGLRQL